MQPAVRRLVGTAPGGQEEPSIEEGAVDFQKGTEWCVADQSRGQEGAESPLRCTG